MAFIERQHCDACGEPDRLTALVSIPLSSEPIKGTLSERYRGKITDQDFKGVSYEIIRCDKCRFLYQKHIPDTELSHRLYSYEPTRIEKSISKKRDAPIDYFIHYALLAEKGLILLDRKPSETMVLDFGSGWGYFLSMMRAHGAIAQGIEISEERVAFSQEQGLAIFTSIEETAPEYDFIYSDQTFEHIPSPLHYLSKLVSRLAPDGIMYVATPNCSGTEEALKDANNHIVNDLYPIEHINGFRNSSLRALASRAGLEVIPPRDMFSALTRKGHLMRDGQFIQEALKAFYTQMRSTSLWLRKIK